jgi:hypothetical protein
MPGAEDRTVKPVFRKHSDPRPAGGGFVLSAHGMTGNRTGRPLAAALGIPTGNGHPERPARLIPVQMPAANTPVAIRPPEPAVAFLLAQ